MRGYGIDIERRQIMLLYFIHTKSICSPYSAWLRNFLAKHACPECEMIYPDVRSRGLDVYVDEPPDIAAVNGVGAEPMSIARRDFLDLFADEVSKYLKLGRVFTADGTLVEGFVTFAGEKRLLLRGSAQSTINPCPICGCLRYMPEYPWYVLKTLCRGSKKVAGRVYI